MFSVSFDPRSLAEITQLYGFQAILNPEFQAAMRRSAELIASRAQANTWTVFANPTGKLASTIVPVVDSPYEVQAGTDSPYGHRRDQGFNGTDSLGRTYHDRPYLFLSDALPQSADQIGADLQQALIAYMDRIAAGG